MTKLIESTLISADGVTDEPGDWALEYFNDEFTAEATELLLGCDAMLLGRGTYEDLAWRWPGQTGSFADAINSIRKYVFSSTLERADWNNSVIVSGDVVTEVERIKSESTRNLVYFGHGRLSRTLLDAGLTDVVRMAVHPVVVGRPASASASPTSTRKLELRQAHPRRSGVVVLTYDVIEKVTDPAG